MNINCLKNLNSQNSLNRWGINWSKIDWSKLNVSTLNRPISKGQKNVSKKTEGIWSNAFSQMNKFKTNNRMNKYKLIDISIVYADNF